MISKAYEQENMNQEKKLGVYMDFLESNPDLRFQKKWISPEPGDIDVQKIGFIQMRCDTYQHHKPSPTFIFINLVPYLWTYTEVQYKMPLRNALHEFLSL